MAPAAVEYILSLRAAADACQPALAGATACSTARRQGQPALLFKTPYNLTPYLGVRRKLADDLAARVDGPDAAVQAQDAVAAREFLDLSFSGS